MRERALLPPTASAGRHIENKQQQEASVAARAVCKQLGPCTLGTRVRCEAVRATLRGCPPSARARGGAAPPARHGINEIK